MEKIQFDFNNMMSFNLGSVHGVTLEELEGLEVEAKKAHEHLERVAGNSISRINVSMEWVRLPLQGKKVIAAIKELSNHIAAQYENVIFLGIGGSYLGLKASQDALAFPYYNEFKKVRGKRPRIFFEGNNVDPQTLHVLLSNLEPQKTFVVVISKSGETIETKAAFEVVEGWLRRGVGSHYGRQIVAITDPQKGSLRKRVQEEQKKDAKSFKSLPLLEGVGGRYSQFNMGLLHMALLGVDLEEALCAARVMAKRCSVNSLYRNPAYLYAGLHYLLYRKKGKSIGVMMPFTESLKATADWYAQLLAESLGKKYGRKIKVLPRGAEEWYSDKAHPVNTGRTPVVCRGTTDLHSIQQNNVEGENNKTLTFIRAQNLGCDIKIPQGSGYIAGKTFSQLLNLAQEATEWSLTRNSRPNCTIILPRIDASNWAGLLFFFELATAFEGELLNVDAFNQPGVEGYKNYMYHKLGKSGIPLDVKNEIQTHPLIKKAEFIL